MLKPLKLSKKDQERFNQRCNDHLYLSHSLTRMAVVSGELERKMFEFAKEVSGGKVVSIDHTGFQHKIMVEED